MNLQHHLPNQHGPRAESRKPRAGLHGVLVIDKPQGPTSHDVVAVARRALREKRIGHTGTLDPMATGVLPLVIGKATRLSALLSSDEKVYEADVRLGAATATYDAAVRIAEGLPPPEAPDLAPEDIARVLERYRGSFEQVPPPFSAKKVDGAPAYTLARRDLAPELAPVPVTVHALDLIEYDHGRVRLAIRTSAGFYVRSLAHDIGVALGCGAHLERLRRTAAGAFSMGDAVTLAELIEHTDAALTRLIPLNRLLPDLPCAWLTEAGTRRASHGNPVGFTDARMGTGPLFGGAAERGGQAPLVRLLGVSGELIGIATAGPDRLLRPSIVLV